MFEKFFDGFHSDLRRLLVGEVKLPRGNAAERHAFQAVFCCQLQAGAVAGSQQFFVCFDHAPVDNRTDRMQDILTGQIERWVIFARPVGSGYPCCINSAQASRSSTPAKV